ncbi:hypothetical protein [Adonisia turfae]|uniref:PEP-CTERM sorting domain-containing protein n=1 Tax=Adonisia turfae CCMR0081 TaxID=2292702 RepID=A0A6M0RWF0_9CYAN|nr:hypothetical protein [Adonisia turfae]NEZ60200.1 hypothetical protein [Adonisia turfae CCMR0081]
MANVKSLAAIATTVVLSIASTILPAQAEVRVLDFEADASGNALSGGTQVHNQWADWGLSIIGKNYKTGHNNAPLLLYDTSQSGADNDLRTGATWGTSNQGNALIIQEYNNGSYNLHTPDDEAKGGHIWFDFDQTVGFKQFSLLDIDDNFGTKSGTQVRVIGKDADNNTILNINVDNLIKRFANTYSDPDHSKSQGKSLTHAYKNGLDEYVDVTITQVGNKRDDNSMFQFDFEETELQRVQFRYSDVSGAISGLQWDDLSSEEPPQLPEPSVTIGLTMMGFIGARKLLQGRLQ